MLTLDTIALVVVLYFSYRSEKEPDKPEVGPFRIRSRVPQGDKSRQASPARLGRRL